jgi:hypothetical protein
MEFALIASILSGICISLMVVSDRIMVGDCYQGNPDHAWFVSSLAGCVFGLILTLLVSIGAIAFSTVTTGELLDKIIELFWWRGVAMVAVGAVGIQILLHYFRCFAEDAHSASIAAWLAATPIFVYLGMLLLTFIGEDSGVVGTLIDPLWILGITLATAGLVLFERLTAGKGAGVGKYKRELILMLICNVVYIVGVRQTLGQSTDEKQFVETLALMPYYWIGFIAGVRVLFKKGEAEKLRASWYKRIRHFVIPILFVEVIGMLVFWFEYLGLTALDPTYVSIVTGASVFLVYALNMGLGWLRNSMLKRGERRIYFGGIRLVAAKLPHIQENLQHVSLELSAIALTAVGIALATTFALH